MSGSESPDLERSTLPDDVASDVLDDVVTGGAVEALHNLLDAPGLPPASGDPVPTLWHWLAFLPRTPQLELGVDGHPAPSGQLASVATGRRMFAGARITIVDAPPVDAQLRRVSSVVGVRDKEGKSGSLRFVTVRHEVHADGRQRISEEQDLVYRPSPASPPASGGVSTTRALIAPQASIVVPLEDDWPWQVTLTPDPTLLFRFSALTYNAHRIHYDLQYATSDEGYPGLVVHGPLQAIMLAELCRRFAPSQSLEYFGFRAVAPAFAGETLRFVGRPSDDDVALRAFDAKGIVTMEAEARFGTRRTGR